jgi:hypothetical protein
MDYAQYVYPDNILLDFTRASVQRRLDDKPQKLAPAFRIGKG